MFNTKRQLRHRRVLITGASSGIGEAIAKEFAKLQARLILTARRSARLDALREEIGGDEGQLLAVPGDITDEEHRLDLIRNAQQNFGGLDILINNAGIGGIGPFASADEARLRQIMEVNFFAPIELIRVSLPLLRQSEDAVVVNVGSVLGHCAVPKKSEYCASKFAMHGITDALRMELAEDGIDMMLMSPSTTKSEFFANAIQSGKVKSNRWAMSPAKVAKATIRAMQVRRRETILSVGGKSLVYANRVFPGMMSKLLQRFA